MDHCLFMDLMEYGVQLSFTSHYDVAEGQLCEPHPYTGTTMIYYTVDPNKPGVIGAQNRHKH
jgi:hypothetical protein